MFPGYRHSMFTCSVLRCTSPRSVFMAGSENLIAGYHGAYVCAEHKELIEAGAPWDMDGRFILMGQDLAPVLASWSARPSVGSEGFTLTLEIVGRIKPIEVFLTSIEATSLGTFIDAVNNDGGRD
ncbi:MAG: hypothetical protein ABWY04_04155 [Arthrobacter sp.]